MLKRILIAAFFLSACSSELAVNPSTKKLKKPTIDNLNKVSGKAGDEISFFGQNLTEDLQILVGGMPATFILDGKNKGSFIIPEGAKSDAGLLQVQFAVKDKNLVTFPVIDSDSTDTLPIIPVPAENVCSTMAYKNEAGELVRGKANCSILLPCSENGETECWTSEGIPAVPKVDLQAKLASGVSFGSIVGTACSVVDSPLATLAGQPAGSSNAQILNGIVAGDDITHYKYKIRQSTDAPCSDALGYSSERSVIQAIDDDITALTDGSLQICVVGKNAEGVWQAESAATNASWTKDTVAPTVLLANVPTGTNNSVNPHISVSGADVSEYKYKIRDALATACSDSVGYSPAVAVASAITDSLLSYADGSLEICVIGRDAAGNWQAEASATTASWTKDTQAPSATISGAPTGTNNTTVLNVAVAGSDVSHYKFKIRTTAEAACSSANGYGTEVAVGTPIATDIAALSDGAVELCVIGRDAYGNWQSEATAATASWIKDALPPAAILSGAPSGTSQSTALAITVSGADVVEYKYKIRESADPACSDSSGYSSAIAVATPVTDNISAKADGIIQVCVIGKDSTGNWQLEGTATIAAWTKDTLAPTASISDAPTGTNNTTILDVTIAGTDVAAYRYKVRVAADPACSVITGYSAEIPVSTKIASNISSLSDGALELCVIGRDAAGNWQALAGASMASWTKDATAPTATITGQPTGTDNASALNVTVAGAGVSHYKYKIRETSDTGCSNSSGYSSEVAVGSPITSNISALADGSLELCVIGRDASGNWQSEASATTANWTKDSSAPVAVLSGEPTGSSKSSNLDITVSGADVVEYKYKIRESADGLCSNSAGYSSATAIATHITDDISSKADGSIEVCVIGKDSAGNWQLEASATTASWSKDTTAPTASISDAPSATNNVTLLDATVAGTDVTHYKYKIRESADAACSVAAGYSAETAVTTKITDTISALADGAFELCVIGRDAAGNWQTEASATVASWTKDTAAPTALLGGEPSGTNAITALNVVVSGSDVTHYKFKVRGTSDAACSNAAGYSSEVPVATAITSDISAMADGTIELCVIGRDATGNWQAEASATAASWTKDALPPAATLSGQPTGTSLATSLDITVGPADVVEYKYKIREAADPSCSNSTGYSSAVAVGSHITDSISALADGVIQVCVIGKDASGNWQLEGVATSASWTKDTSAPTATVSNAPSGTNNTTVLDVTIAGTDVSHYKYKIRESADAACSVASGYSSEIAVSTKIASTISSLGDGVLELCVIGRDAAGNWQAEASATTASWTKDTAAPTATIGGEPTGTNNNTVLNVSVAGADVSHYKFKVRDTSDAACSNATGYSSEAAVGTPITSDISGLGDGVIELCVIGRDAYGNWQAETSATTASWTKDALPPAATLSGQPSGTSLTTGLDITVGGSDVVEYKYKIRESADPSCTNSAGYSAATAVATHITSNIGALADGAIQVCVIGKDASGNWQLEGVATTASWTKDTSAPTATVSDAPTATNNTTVMDVTVAGTDVTHYKYKIRESADSACSVAAGYSTEVAVSTKITSNISSLADGTIELCVIGRDDAGNWQAEASATTASWTKDTSAPTATISAEPTGTNNATILNVGVAGADVTHYKFKVREASDPSCSNATGYSSEVAVATPITSNISTLDDGVIELCVIGRDVYGNWQAEASATTASWTKDALPPAATLSGQPTGNSLATSLNITVAGADVVEYKYKIREAADPSCTSSSGYSSALAVATHITDSITSLADGSIQVCVIGKDASGNWQLEGTATTASWTKDTQAPIASIADQPTGTNGTTALNVTIAGTDVTHYKYKIRESASTACSNSAGYSSEIAVASKITDAISALADGAIELCLIGRDDAGNWQTEASATAVSWTKDTTAPTATISGEPAGASAATTLHVTIAGTDVTHYKYKIREAADPACSVSAGYSAETAVGTLITSSIVSLTDGSIQLCVIGKDSSGNWQAEASATTASWTKDTTAPLASISGAPGASSNVTSLDITVSGTDVVEYKYKIRESADAACTVGTGYSSAIAVATHITDSIAAKADGNIEVCVIGKDSAGNWQAEASATTATWTKDSSAPTASLSNAPSSTNNANVLDVTVAGTGVTHYKYKLREAADTACSVASGYSSEITVATKITNNISAYADGALELCVIGRDAAGNWQDEASATTASWTRDTSAPTATVSGEPTGTNNAVSLNVSVAGTDVTHYKYKIRESADAACSSASGYSSETAIGTPISDNISSKADGSIELCVIGRDASGNWQAEASATAVSWTKDSTGPVAAISGNPTGSSLATSLDITVSGTDVVEYKYKIRAAADSACSVSAGYSSAVAVATHITNDISGKADGALEVCVIGKDAQGNWQAEASASTVNWTKDTLAPTATISSAPTGTNNGTSLNIAVAGAGVTEYKYKIRESATSACSVSAGYSSAVAVATPVSDGISSFADGAMEICVIGRDAAGNWQAEASATSVTWTKDTAAPTATLSGQPTGTNSITALNVGVAGSDVTHYKYKIRESADAACSNSSGYSSEVAVATAITDSISAKSDGSIELCVIGRDAYGNWQAEASATTASWTKDTVAPMAVISGSPTGSSLTTSLDITISGTDVVEYKYKIRATADSACSVSGGYSSAVAVATHITSDISGKADGTIEVCVIAKDAQGNWQTEASATTATWTKDTVAPTVSLSDAPTGTNNATSLNITVAGTGVTEYKYKIRESATTACSVSVGYSAAVAVATAITDSISGFADGAMEICVIGRDAAGNWQVEASATSATWTKDTAAPTATVSGQPTGTNNTATLNVTVAGSGVTHYKYKVRESADAACSSASGYSSEIAAATAITDNISAKADGAFELCVVGRDASGNWQSEASATTASWTKDTAAPTATVSGNPTGTNLVTTLDITVAGTGVLEYKYKIRASADAACSDSTGYSSALAVATHITDSISAKADGTIEVCVIGKDSAGNWQAEGSATSVTWTKDTTAPTASIAGNPSGTNNATSLNVTIAGTGVSEYKYKIRESASSACSNSAGYSSAVAVATAVTDSISGLADGPIEICAVAKDAAGNWQAYASATSATWTKDTAAPTATLSGQPTGTNNTTTLNVTVAGTGVSHYKYKVRESADAACSSSSGYGSEIAVATAITDSISAKADGDFELCVIGRDASGNWQTEASATTATWTKDTAAPTATISGNPTGTSLATTLNITVAGTDVVEYKYKIRETADGACSNSAGYSSALAVATPIADSISAKADGTIEVCVIGKDSAGNWQAEASATSVTWTKDTTAPIASLSGNPSGTSNATSLSVTIAGTGVTEYKYKIRQSASTACSNSTGYSSAIAVANPITDSIAGLTDGTIEICVVGRDAVGNWQAEASATTASWTKDTTAPTATISGAPSGTNNATVLSVTVSGTGVSHYKYKIRQSLDVACSNASGYSSEVAVGTSITDDISALADGALELCVVGRDAAGNWQAEASAATASWTKDTVAPTATLSGAPTGTDNTTTLNITVAGSGVVEYKYKVRASADAACTNSSGYSSAIAVATKITDSISAKADGAIEVCVIGKDSAGNWQLEASATAASWTKDTTAPTATVSGAPTGTNATTLLDVTIAGTGVTHYKYKIRASADSACSNSSGYSSEVAVATHITDSVSAKADGAMELCVIGRDSAGNYQLESAATSVTWTKDTVPPTASLSGQPTGSSRATTLSVTVGGTGVTHYKYKVRDTSGSACSDSSGYSAETAIATLITDNISGKADGTIEICVVGRGISGLYQAYASATSATWTKDLVAPPAPVSLVASPRETAVKAVWASGGGDSSGYILLRRATTAISDAPTAGTTYSVGNTIGSSTVAYVGSSLTLADTSLTNGTKYNYKVFSYDAAKNYSATGVAAAARPVTYEPPSPDSLLFWTDASYTDSLFTDTGCATAVSAADQTVACQKDLTSYSAVLTQATSGNRPVYKTANLYGHPALQHTDNHWLTASSTNIPSGNLQHSLVYIGSFGDTVTSGAIHIGGTANDTKIRLYGDSSLIQYAFGGNDLQYTPPSTDPELFIGTYNGVNGTTTNRKLFLNGVQRTPSSTNGTLTNTLNLPANPGVTIGSNSTGTQGLTGNVGEFLLYDHDLSSSEIIELSRYAWNKWGIPQIELTATSLLSGVVLNWTDGVDSASYLLVKKAGSVPATAPTNGVSYSAGGTLGGDSIIYAGSSRTYTDTSLVEGTTYYYALYGNDGSNNYRPVVSTSATVLVTPTLTVSSNNAKLDLSWGSAPDASGFLLVRRASSAPTFTPTNGTTYSTGVQGSDTIVYIGTANSFQDTGLTNGTTYYYKLFAYDSAKNYASPKSDDGLPVAPCSGSTTNYTSNQSSVSIPAGCTTLVVKAWGGGGAGGIGGSDSMSGAGGGAGYATKTVTVNASTTIAITIGTGGSCSGTGGTGYANGGGSAANTVGTAGGGTGSGGAAGSGAKAGGAGKYGGGGGGGSSYKGGAGGGATAVTINGTASVIAGGGGGGGGGLTASSGGIGGKGGAGCAVAGSSGLSSGGGGGGGACLGDSTANGSGTAPGNSAEASGNATGGSGGLVLSCGSSQNGKAGMVTLIFSP